MKARADLRKIERTTGSIAAVATLGVIAGGLFSLAGWTLQPLILMGGPGVILGLLFGVAWWRAAAANRATQVGPFERVHAVGWCRPPDGCNFAMFVVGNDERDAPDYVLRLPLRRRMTTGDAWLCGSPNPALLGGVALVSDGGLLGSGRIVSPRVGLERWKRRRTRPSQLVMRPPDKWLPPGGE